MVCAYVYTLGGALPEFTVTYNVMDDTSVDITIDVIAQDGLDSIAVILTIEQLSSCPSDTVNNIGPVSLHGMEMMYRSLYGTLIWLVFL